MPGQRGLGCDLRGFEVTDFADHDDIGILAQDGAQQGGEGQADLRFDLNLVDAPNWYSIGSSTVMTLRDTD